MSTLRANHGSWASWRPMLAARPAAPRGGSARYSASDRLRPTYRHRPENVSLARIASVTPIDENESWISMVPPWRTRAPHEAMSSPAGLNRWAPSMWRRSIAPGTSSWASCENLRTYVTRSRTPARSRLVRKTLWSTAASSSKPSISCGPRSLPAWGSMAKISTPSGAALAMAIIDRPRKLPISTMRPPAGTSAARAETRATWSGLNQPSTPSSASSRAGSRAGSGVVTAAP